MIDFNWSKAPEIVKVTIVAVAIVGGALANTTMTYKEAREASRPYRFVDWIIGMILACFSGTVVALFAQDMGIEGNKLLGISALSAYLSINILNKLIDIIIKDFKGRLGK